MIDRLTIDKIMDAANIVDVVSDFVALKRAGANYKGLCPFHDDRTPSFMVSPAKNYCKCFACGKGGNPVGFIMEHEQLTYPDALRWLAKKYGITIEEKELTAEEKASQGERESMFIVNEWANKWFQDQLRNTQDGRAIGMAYFRGRGFRDDIIEKFQLGYSPSQRDACTQAALKAGYQEQFLTSDPDSEGIAHGVGISIKRDNGTLFDRFAGRVMFPIFTVSGKVVGFGGRVLDKATKGVSVKYQNSPESIIYHKKSELYGLYQAKQAINKQDCVFMVEGYTDVIAMHQSGVENVVASSGTALTHEQIRLIHRFTSNIVVLYDGDAAGIKASQRGIDMLLRDGMNVKLLLLPDGKDPDEFARDHSPQEMQQYMQEHQVDFIRFKTDLLMKEAQGDPIKMSRLVNNIVQSIAVIPDEITRTLYIRETSQMMQLKEGLIADAVSKQIKVNIDEWRKEKERENRRVAILQGQPTNGFVPQGQPADNFPPQGLDGILPQEGSTPSSLDSFPPSEGFEGFPPSEPSDEPMGIPGNFGGATETRAAGTDYGRSKTGDRHAASLAERRSISSRETQHLQPRDAASLLPMRRNEAETVNKLERLIIQTIIRYGEKTICSMPVEGEEDRPLTVIELVYYSLQQDALTFTTPLYQRIMEESMEHVHDEGFMAERFFLNHPEQEINSLAFELGTDREQLSKLYEKQNECSLQEEYNSLIELTRHLLTDFKLEVVKQRKSELMLQMRDPAFLTDKNKRTSLMQQLMEVKEQENRLSKECGDRVLIR